MKNTNIRIIAATMKTMTAKITTFFTQFNFFNTMNKCKNFARLFLCVFAIVGGTACNSSSSPSSSTPQADLSHTGLSL